METRVNAGRRNDVRHLSETDVRLIVQQMAKDGLINIPQWNQEQLQAQEQQTAALQQQMAQLEAQKQQMTQYLQLVQQQQLQQQNYVKYQQDAQVQQQPQQAPVFVEATPWRPKSQQQEPTQQQ